MVLPDLLASLMGSCQSQEAVNAAAISRQIDKELNKDPDDLVQKLLLLGPGESGKSTCLKQMQILHNNGFSDMEIEERKGIVYSNTLRSALDIVNAMPLFGIIFENKEREADSALLLKHVDSGLEYTPFPPEIKVAIANLWADGGVQACFGQRNRFQLNDSAQYFLESLDRISRKDYRPTTQDILYTRMPTTGVVKMNFVMKGVQFNVFDVGGQRSERRKWIHFFDEVQALIFVVGISEYDQTLREDNKTNRLIEALELFDTISTSKFFLNTSMILFLNKKDLFAEKIAVSPLTICFPRYTGKQEYREAIEYLKDQFIKLHTNRQKLYIHETCATDTNQVQHVFNSVIDSIIQENLKDTGML